MSISVTNYVNISQAALKFLVQEENDDKPEREWKTIGGVLSNSDYAWTSNGARLQVVHTKTGNKVGAWTFGWILKDSDTKIICVQEIQRPNGRLPLLAIGIDCDFSGGMICIFDFMSSKIIRAIQIKDKITTLQVIDAGYDVFILPGPLRNFDGIIAVGTAGGDVYLVDICRQICDEALTLGGLNEIRDELNPSLLFNITSRDLGKIEHHKEFAIRNSQHLAIHLNVIFDKSTKHFILKGPKGDDRIHVNKDEVAVSALYYCPQLGSLLVGYNFGALQLYNLMNLELVYTSPVWDEHIPISHFAIQEPADDPKAVCYVWAIYSIDEGYSRCLPLAVMYAFSYQTKEYHEGYGCLYQDFCSASVQYQMELGVPFEHSRKTQQRGGNCLNIKSITHGLSNRDGLHHESNEDNFTLCLFVWNVWFNKKESETFLAIFDLNQWYKEQMPNVPKSEYYSTYMLQLSPNELINSATNKCVPILDIHLVDNSIQLFTGAQRLEEHFYPNSLTFVMACLRESDVVFLRNYGVQKALLAQIESSGPLCLVEPAHIYQEVVSLGLVPLFIDLPVNAPITTNQQREIILGAALENHLVGWLCKCASEWANGSFLSAGCSMDLLITWAFQRAITLKTNCDKFCMPLFDYSGMRLDNNTNILLSRCRRQLKNLCSLYGFILQKLWTFISNHALVEEQFKSLETVSVYFEVLQWLLNVRLLPECPLSAYPRSDDLECISAPYAADMLAEFYNHRRALLKILNEENFSSSESVLFIDALIERECGGRILQEEWRNDGGNGLYPPPSLQALLRTYLIDDVNLFYKHSVIIYVFLDLAMTLDQDKYKLVITQLIKFPAVFKVSPSVIKITQGFWQLDHCDFNTAMGLLLDPLVSSEDLTQWHHTIVLRALMLQKQHNFALYYVQVRKPVLKEDGDILTAISLYVANNMIDEAFYFVKHFSIQPEEDKLLLHLFNECKKNEKLRTLIYRSLNSSDENIFLKYLTDSKESIAEDLHVYHHILRSHFIEAFESHERNVPNQIENQGLLGQENAIPRDKLVSCLKKLLIGFGRDLVNLCQKENHHVWQLVSRPTQMSIVVHSFTENVQYKSTAIGSSLGKAQQKFEMDTMATPFLPNSTSSKRSSTVIVNPKIIDMDLDVTDCSPPPSKRLKVSPRLSTPLSVSIPYKLDTPLVKRKTSKGRDSSEELKLTTPHSILKVKSFVTQTSPKKDGEFEDDFKEFEKLEYTPVNLRAKKLGLRLSPRKSLPKSSPVVRFQGFQSTSSSSLNNTRSSFEKSPIYSPKKLSLSPVVTSNDDVLNESSKNTSLEDDIFYSPNSSAEKLEQVEKDITVPLTENDGVAEDIEVTTSNEKVVSFETSTCNISEIEKDSNTEVKLSSSPLYSPKGRKSYRRSLQLTPVRSSPRLSKNSKATKESSEFLQGIDQIDESVSSNTSAAEETKDVIEEKIESFTDPPKSSPEKPKLRPRKSLCRQVLETNALSRVLDSPINSPRIRRSRTIETSTVTNVEETTEKILLNSTTKYEDGEEKRRSSLIRKHSFTSSFNETDIDTSNCLSINSVSTDDPKLSESTLEYVRASYIPVSANNAWKSLSSGGTSKNNVTTSMSNSALQETSENVTQEVSNTQGIEDNAVILIEDSETSVKVLQNENASDVANSEETNASFNVSSSDDKSVAYSTFDNSTEGCSFSCSTPGIKLSESMARYIEDRTTENQCINATQNEDEVMEVDDDDNEMPENTEENKTEVDKNTSDEPKYTTLTTNTSIQVEKPDTTMELVYEKENKEKENVESSHGSGSTNRPVDPEMNVFEISDDLSFNDGILIEREVTLEENDLCYGQQNTLENVLEENISITGSSPLNVLEKNVFNQSYESEESDEEEEIQEEPPFDSKSQDVVDEANEVNEVIEIGSSSEEETHSNREESQSESHSLSRSSSSSDDDNEQKERYIYDSDNDYSSRSSYERPYSEISENSDDVKYEQTKVGCGLFEGSIIFTEEKQKNVDKNTEKIDVKTYSEKEETEKTKQANVKNFAENEEVEQMPRKGDVLQNSPESNIEHGKNDKNAPSPTTQTETLEHDDIDMSIDKSDASIEMEELNYPTLDDATVQPSNAVVSPTKNINDERENLGQADQVKISSEQLKSSSPLIVPDGVQTKQNNSVVLSQKDNSLNITENNEKSPRNVQLTIESTSFNDNVGETKQVDSEDLNFQSSPKVIEREMAEKERDVLDSLLDHNCDKKDVPRDEIVKKLTNVEQDALETLTDSAPSTPAQKLRPRSVSVSSSTSTKSTKRGKRKVDGNVSTEVPVLRPRTRSTDILEKSEASTKKHESDKIEDLTTKPQRTLRSRRVSTDETPTKKVSLRKRSSSVDETKFEKDESTDKVDLEVKKTRSRRATSIVNLTTISEENSETENKSKNVLEDYSFNRRLTRRQVTLLQKIGGDKHDLGVAVPVVILDKMQIDAQPEEQKEDETSPTSTNSTSRVNRKTRSASQPLETTRRSKSKTPVRNVKSLSRKESTDEEDHASKLRSSRRKLEEKINDDAKEEAVVPEPKATRSRTRSVSSIASDDSAVSNTSQVGRKSRKLLTQSVVLPDIQEEPKNIEKSTVPKKRTRKNSSQL